MATVYISPTGAGTGSGDSEANAVNWNSGTGLGTAETAAGSGGTIIFLDGSYPFGGTETFAGASGLTYESQNPNEAVLGDLGTQRTLSSATNGGITLKGFKTVDLIVTLDVSVSSCTIDQCYLSATIARNYGLNSHAIRAGSNSITPNSGFVKNSVIEIKANTSADRITQGMDLEITSCTWFMESGSTPTGNMKFLYMPKTLKNNIWYLDDSTKWSTTGDGVFADDSSNSCFYQMGSGNTSGGTNNIFEDPQFVDSANGDYRLRPTSPCIGAGTAS